MARYLSATGQRWLKSLHLVLVCAWMGGALSLVLAQAVLARLGGQEVGGVHLVMKLIDDWVIIPGAMGCLVTGLLYSVWTKWGFFRHGWVTAKWVLTIAQIFFGTFWLGPWLNANVELARLTGSAVATHPVFLHNAQSNLIGGTIQGTLLVGMIGLSIFKPRKRPVSKG